MLARVAKSLITQTSVGAVLGRIPGARHAFKSLVWRHPHFVKSYLGSFDTYAAASAAAPAEWDIGWDNDGAYFSEWAQPSFYAAMYWLSSVLKPGDTIVDFGGHFGGAYKAFNARQPLPDGASWIVVEVPAVAQKARTTGQADGHHALSFTDDLKSIPVFDIFFSAGSIQYLDADVSALASMITEKRPRHIVLNNFALTQNPGFWSLQHLGGAMAPNQIFNESEFIGAFEKRGYALRDRWEVAELNCQVFFEPQRYVPAYSGVVFDRADF